METTTFQLHWVLFALLALLRLLPKDRVKGYILQNTVTHARILPAASKHAFVYPTTSLLVSLKAMERKELDLGYGLVFGYGGLWGRLTGIRPDPYLTCQKGSIWFKLESVLAGHGLSSKQLEDAWMMTMPSYLGFEGINPLTVYFCYRPNNEFWLVVLEVHNTFGENHVYILEVGKKEQIPSKGFEHEWAFRRAFHVSPFNDRSGFYVVSVTRPSHAPSQDPTTSSHPLPTIRVHLHLDNPKDAFSPGPLKLIALLRPVVSTPLSTAALVTAVIKAPVQLLSAFPQIAYQAWILHYKKRLDVFIRPEPRPSWGTKRAVGGVKWLPEGSLEAFSRRKNEEFLRKRVDATGIAVRLVAGDPLIPDTVFLPRWKEKADQELIISYTASKFFSILFTSPSAKHALLMGSKSERLFVVSDEALFLRVYDFGSPSLCNMTRCQRLRIHAMPASIELPIPCRHPFDASHLRSYVALWVMQAMDDMESVLFRLAKVRTVKDNEPWYKEQWQRAASVMAGGEVTRPVYELGSVSSALP